MTIKLCSKKCFFSIEINYVSTPKDFFFFFQTFHILSKIIAFEIPVHVYKLILESHVILYVF
jgi:hypothetical protein